MATTAESWSCADGIAAVECPRGHAKAGHPCATLATEANKALGYDRAFCSWRIADWLARRTEAAALPREAPALEVAHRVRASMGRLLEPCEPNDHRVTCELMVRAIEADRAERAAPAQSPERPTELCGYLMAGGRPNAEVHCILPAGHEKHACRPAAPPTGEPPACPFFTPDEYAAGVCARCNRYEADHGAALTPPDGGAGR